MRVALTGARGTLGQGIVRGLLTHDYNVVAIHRTPDRGFVMDRRVENRVADLTNSEAAYAALTGCQALLHLAAIPNPKDAAGPKVFTNNLSCVYNVLHAAANQDIRRVVYASSQSALGNPWNPTLRSPQYIPVDEMHPCKPVEPYGLSKWLGEHVCDMFARAIDMRILSFRLPAIWPAEEFQQRVNDRLTDEIQAAKSMWAYIDLRDAAHAHLLALEADWQGHEVLNITSRWAFGAAPTPRLVRRWYADLEDIRVSLEASTPIFDWHKAEQVLGFRSRYRWTREGILDSGTDEL